MVSSAKYPSLGFVAVNIILGIGAVILVAISFSGPTSGCVFGQTDSMPRGNPGVCALATATGFVAFLGPCIALTLAFFMDEVMLFLRIVAALFGGIMILWCITSGITSAYLAQTCRNVASCTEIEGWDEASGVVGFCWINLAAWVIAVLYAVYRLHSQDKLEAAEAAAKKPADLTESDIRARVYARYGRGKHGEYPDAEFGKRHPFVITVHLLLMAIAIVLIGLSFGGPSQCFYGRSASTDAGIGGICALVTATGFVGVVSAAALLGFAAYMALKTHFVMPRAFYQWTSSATFFMCLLWAITSIVASAGLENTCRNLSDCKTTTGYAVTGWSVAFCWINTAVWALAFLRYGMLFARIKQPDVEEEVAVEVKKEQEAEKEIQREIENSRRARSPPEPDEEEKFVIAVSGPPSPSRPFQPMHSPGPSPSPSPRTARLYEEAEAIRREAEQRARFLNEEQDRFERFAYEDRERARQIAREDQLRQQRFEEETFLWNQRMEHDERRRKERYAEEDERRRLQFENDMLRRQAQKQSELRSHGLEEAEQQLAEERAAEARIARALLHERASDRLAQEAFEAETRRRQEAHARAASEDHRRLLEEELQRREQRVGDLAQDIAHGVKITLHVPRLAQPALAQTKHQTEAKYHVTLKVVNSADTSMVTITGADQTHAHEALRHIEDVVNEQIRRDFGQGVDTDEPPEYLSWLGKRGNLAVSLSKIYDQYPAVLQIKRVFDSADNEDGGGRGYLDRQQLIASFEELFPACKRGHGPEFGGYLYDVLMAQPGPRLEGVGWKDFIFYCLSRRLIVLKKEKKR